MTLPSAAGFPQGTPLTVLDETGACTASKSITLAAAGSDTINGVAAIAIVTPYGYICLQSNGANRWTVIDQAAIANRRTFTDVSLDNGSTTYGSTFSRLPIAAVNQDAGANWDAANYWYTCPRAGVYQITGSLRVGPYGATSSYGNA